MSLSANTHADRRFYYLGLALVVGLSFGLRFWQLGRFNSLVFDEVYYVKFAQAYLAGEPVFDAHPPMGKYAIAAGIWLYQHTAWLHAAAQTIMAEVDLAPVSYRWMTALAGSLTPLVVMGLARSLTVSPKAISPNAISPNAISLQAARENLFGILAGVFVAIDGLFVTESRYGLINIYVVFFGLLGHWLWVLAKGEKYRNREGVLKGLSGVALGCAIATKWNGLGYVLTLVVWEVWQQIREQSAAVSIHSFLYAQRYNFLQGILYIGLLPLLTYSLIWAPHIQLNEDSFLSIHRTLFLFHQGLDESQVACSRWFTWPLLIKPIAYWYKTSGTQAYTVNNLGNPALWWTSSASVVLLGIDQLSVGAMKNHQNDITGYLLIGYLANWLPWIVVSRCTYNYLHMPAAVFGFMLLAWVLSGWMRMSSSVFSRRFGFVALSAIALAFLFWLPLSLGLGLSPEQLQLRWWLPTWI